MFPQRNDSEELGVKVRRAHYALEKIRGTGVVKGVRVIIDHENRLLSVTVDEEDIVLAAYQEALRDKEPKVDEAMRELRADPRVEAASTFVEANAARSEAERARRQQQLEEAEDRFFEERHRRGWFDR
ncbi:YbaB/EbfC family nucleoid-associated protein [Nocardia terpenica]|uniref:YbaB/EbfC family nucleoid-associated protein n=1 Tax=Nocardia terpenica TaxID=455432 RepID=UPI002FE35DB5